MVLLLTSHWHSACVGASGLPGFSKWVAKISDYHMSTPTGVHLTFRVSIHFLPQYPGWEALADVFPEFIQCTWDTTWSLMLHVLFHHLSSSIPRKASPSLFVSLYWTVQSSPAYPVCANCFKISQANGSLLFRISSTVTLTALQRLCVYDFLKQGKIFFSGSVSSNCRLLLFWRQWPLSYNWCLDIFCVNLKLDFPLVMWRSSPFSLPKNGRGVSTILPFCLVWFHVLGVWWMRFFTEIHPLLGENIRVSDRNCRRGSGESTRLKWRESNKVGM